VSETEVLIQQLIIGLSNGLIIALIALGYTMVYGIVELINFAHGDNFMLGSFFSLTIIGLIVSGDGSSLDNNYLLLLLLLFTTPIFCGFLNWCIDRFAYRPLRNSPRLAPLVSAIGVSFILMNIGLFWGGVPMQIFNNGNSAAAPKNFPDLIGSENLLGEASNIFYTPRDLLVFLVTVPLLCVLTYIVKCTKLGRSMRAVAQNQTAASLMGINSNKVIGHTFIIGGALAGIASVIYSIYNNTIYFQMGYRVGIDAFTAAVLGGIGNLPGAVLGGVLIGIIRALSDQYIATSWTNVVVFIILVLCLIFKPTGLLGSYTKEKV